MAGRRIELENLNVSMEKETKIKQKIEETRKAEQEKVCKDKHCPLHSGFSLRGRTFEGNVVKVNIHKTATVEWSRLFYIHKYERYEKRKTRLKVHVPDCTSVMLGDTVKIIECRPISKTKHFVVTEVKR